MTTKEWRDRLAAEFPGCTVYFKADSWHWPKLMAPPHDVTTFSAGVYAPDGIVACYDCLTPEAAVDGLRKKMGVRQDIDIEATPEPQEAVL